MAGKEERKSEGVGGKTKGEIRGYRRGEKGRERKSGIEKQRK